jgi:hypothetical protein
MEKPVHSTSLWQIDDQINDLENRLRDTSLAEEARALIETRLAALAAEREKLRRS